MESKAGKSRRGNLRLASSSKHAGKPAPMVLQHPLTSPYPEGVRLLGPWVACDACTVGPALQVDGVLRHFSDCDALQLVCFDGTCDCSDDGPYTCSCSPEADAHAPFGWRCSACGNPLHFINCDTSAICSLVSPAEGGKAGRAPSAELSQVGDAIEPAPSTLRSPEHPTPHPAPLDAAPVASTAKAVAGAKRRRTAARSTPHQVQPVDVDQVGERAMRRALGVFFVAEEAKRLGRALQSCSGDVLHVEHPDQRSRALCRPMTAQTTCDVADPGAQWCVNCCRIALAWINRAAAVSALMFWLVTPAQWKRGAEFHRWLDGLLIVGGAS